MASNCGRNVRLGAYAGRCKYFRQRGDLHNYYDAFTRLHVLRIRE